GRRGKQSTDGAPAPTFEGVDHVTQTLACCHCCGRAGSGCVGSDLCLCLGRLAWWPPSRGMGRPTCRDRRRPRLLWVRLWRLLCAAPRADRLGTAMAAGQPLLLIPP